MGQPGHDVRLDPKHMRRGQRPDVLGDFVALDEPDTGLDGPAGEVLGQIGPHRGVGEEAGGGDPLLHLPPYVGAVPRRVPRTQPDQDGRHRSLAVEVTDTRRPDVDRQARLGEGVAVAQIVQLLDPVPGHRRPVRGDHLVRTCVLPRPPIPRTAHRRPRLLARVRQTPLRLVAVDVAPDLRRPGTELPHIGRQLLNLA